MKCIHCDHEKSSVIETKKLRGVVHRRRRCMNARCGQLFFSEEKATSGRKFPQEIIDAMSARLHGVGRKTA